MEKENSDYPNWIRYFIKLARPGAMLAMFSLLIFGGLIFAISSMFYPEATQVAMDTFTQFLGAIDDEYYETLRFMFGAYVAGRSGQVIAERMFQIREENTKSTRTTRTKRQTEEPDEEETFG